MFILATLDAKYREVSFCSFARYSLVLIPYNDTYEQDKKRIKERKSNVI